jgi:hypothetical protein
MGAVGFAVLLTLLLAPTLLLVVSCQIQVMRLFLPLEGRVKDSVGVLLVMTLRSSAALQVVL